MAYPRLKILWRGMAAGIAVAWAAGPAGAHDTAPAQAAGVPGLAEFATAATAPSEPTASGCLDFDNNLPKQDFSNIGNTDRSVAVDINQQVSVSSLSILYQSGADHQLDVVIRQVNGNIRGGELARASIQVGVTPKQFHVVPINFTFNPGTRYDIGFVASPDWGFNTHSMELLFHNNPNLDPNQGFDVGPFKILDGGADRASGYANSLMPHVQACVGGGDRCTYTVSKSKAKGGCEACPRRGESIQTDENCDSPEDCRKKVKTTISCPNKGPGTCKIKAKRSACG